jgi:hypothetical protein
MNIAANYNLGLILTAAEVHLPSLLTLTFCSAVEQ